jgi:Thoeris protein ThsB, TIR-like domain
MARRVFFSFHYERDISRANIVRNSWVTKADRDAAGFFDAGLWEEAKKKGDAAIRAMIDNALKNTSVTAVLIGRDTADRNYVKYEIDQSIARGNGVLGVYIHKIRNLAGETDETAKNPLPSKYSVHAWNRDKGYANFGTWVEDAAKAAGR